MDSYALFNAAILSLRFDDNSICLLLAFHLKNGGRSVILKLLVTQLLQHPLRILPCASVQPPYGHLGFHVNHIAKRYGIFVVPTMKEAAPSALVLHSMEEGYIFMITALNATTGFSDNLQLRVPLFWARVPSCKQMERILLITSFHHFKLG